MRFKGKVVMITGAASGMGAASAKLFADEGAFTIIIDKSEPTASDTSKFAATFIGDVADSSFCNDVAKIAVKRFERIDVLVNAAGVIARADALATSDAIWQRVMNVNVNGLFYMSRAVLPPMKAQQSGSIINFGSIWGSVGAAGVLAYCASKGAVHQITKAMALELAQTGVRVNAVCPGEVNTPMLRSERKKPITEELLDELVQPIPMGRLAEPEEIARVVLFLASDDASYMTGALVNVDAGYTAR